MFSRRMGIPSPQINALTAAVAQRRRLGLECLDLTASNPTQAQLAYDWAAIHPALSSASVQRYQPVSRGAWAAREAVVSHLLSLEGLHAHGFTDMGAYSGYDPERLTLTATTSEAYGYLFKLLCDPGDCVLVPEPSYPLFEQLARYEGVRLVSYQLNYDGAWYIEPDSVQLAMKSKPRAIVAVSPNNPTGSCLAPTEYQWLLQLGLPLIIDQVFAPYVLRRSNIEPLNYSEQDGLVFVLDGLSKRCGLPQLKVGWIATFGARRRVHAALDALDHITDAYLSLNGAAEGALEAVLSASAVTRDDIRARLGQNLEVLHSAIAQGAPVSLLHYQGGWSVMLQLPRFLSDEAWAHRLLESGVLVQPGWLYDCPLSAVVVLSLLTDKSDFSSGIEQMMQLVKAASG